MAAYWLKQAYELSRLPKPDGSLWHAFRRLWATERKNLPVKDVAAAGGWKDTTTLIECYQQRMSRLYERWWSISDRRLRPKSGCPKQVTRGVGKPESIVVLRAARQKYLQRGTDQVFYLTGNSTSGNWIVEGPADDPEPFRLLGTWKSRIEALRQLAPC